MVVEASPWEESSSLVAYGGDNQLTILRRTSSLGSTTRGGAIIESLRFSHVANFAMSGKVSCLAWSPQASADEQTSRVSLAAACSDHTVQCHFATEFETHKKVLVGHLDYINSLAFVAGGRTGLSNATHGVHLASASDDHTVHLWNVEQESAVQVLALNSPGMSVKFNSQEPNLLMAAEAKGDLTVFDLRGHSLVAFSLHSEHSSLLDADWSSCDSTLFGAVANKRWTVWDCRSGALALSAQPEGFVSTSLESSIPTVIEGPAAPSVVSKFRWSHTTPTLFATLGAPSSVTVWDTANPQAPISESIAASRIGGISWLRDRACLLSASYRSISFTLL